ncbi:MAG TPA: hypothetical protein VJC03_09495 [bacterium]|nr:hypothetical protein [bacterium]
MDIIIGQFQALSQKEKIEFLRNVLPPLLKELLKDEKFKKELEIQMEPYLKDLPLPARMLLKSYLKF